MKAKLIKVDTGWILMVDNKIYASHNDILSIKNCQAIERGYDLDELIKNDYIKHSVKDDKLSLGEQIQRTGGFNVGYKEGFQKALELMGDKKFSEEDVMLGWDAGVMSQSICFTNYFGLKRESELKSHRESYQGNLKPSALQQTEWDVEIEMKKVKDETKIVGAVKGVKGSGSKITTYKSVPKLDADGCLILKLKSE